MTDDPTPSLAELTEAFRLTEVEAESLTRFARVHRARTAGGQPVVVKRAGSNADRVRALARWTRGLAAADIPVVAPVEGMVENPQEVGDDWWVVYPFVNGDAYAGTATQIETAGDLLGRIHAAGEDVDGVYAVGLRDYAWPETARAEVDADLETLERVLTDQGDPDAFAAVRALGNRWWEHKDLLASRDADLPRRAGSSDFKANNLIWDGPVPTLVDPDNGGREPRLFELAHVATLFHNECHGAPGRLLEAQEWAQFVGAYARHVRLTDNERELWPLVFDHIAWEEGTWVLEDNDEQAWADPRQRAFLLALARADAADFPLPPA